MKITKHNSLYYILFIMVFGAIWLTNVIPVSGETEAEQIINTFMSDKQLGIEKNTEEYMEFMKGIMLGDYPELTGENSKYINSQEELDLILEYVSVQLSPLYKDYPVEVEINEALSGVDESDRKEPALLTYGLCEFKGLTKKGIFSKIVVPNPNPGEYSHAKYTYNRSHVSHLFSR